MKKLLSLLLVFSMSLSIASIPSYAADTSATDSHSQVIDLEGDAYAEMIDAGLVDASFLDALRSSSNGDELTPPPDLVIEEGEVWIPGAIDPGLISLHGEDDECRHRGEPANYQYIGAVRGNTNMDVASVNVLIGAISLYVPVAGIIFTIATIIGSALESLGVSSGDKISGDYIKYQYRQMAGLDPSSYWFHYFYSTKAVDGRVVPLGCIATYSPEKPGDRFQD